MKKMIMLTLAAILVFSVTACGGQNQAGSNYPEKQITVIVPWGSGDGVDLTTRAFADFAEEELGQTVVVQNKPGGGGAVGHTEASKQQADGYNLLTASTGALTVKPSTGQVGYATEDFSAIGQMVEMPVVVAVNKDAPYDSLKDLFEHAQENEVTFSTPAPGTSQHVIMEQLANEYDMNLSHVSGKGGNGAVSNVMGGHVDAVAVGPAPLSGKDVKLLGVSTAERDPYLPDVPTFQEQGYDFSFNLFFGLVAPSGTPDEAINTMSETLEKAMQDEELQEKWKNLGVNPVYLDSQEFQDKIDRYAENMGQAVEEIGLAE